MLNILDSCFISNSVGFCMSIQKQLVLFSNVFISSFNKGASSYKSWQCSVDDEDE
jgi:hypothetical protein